MLRWSYVAPMGLRSLLSPRTGGQIEIVGIAGDVRYRDLRTGPPRMVYVPALQREAEEETVFAIRAAGDPRRAGLKACTTDVGLQ